MKREGAAPTAPRARALPSMRVAWAVRNGAALGGEFGHRTTPLRSAGDFGAIVAKVEAKELLRLQLISHLVGKSQTPP